MCSKVASNFFLKSYLCHKFQTFAYVYTLPTKINWTSRFTSFKDLLACCCSFFFFFCCCCSCYWAGAAAPSSLLLLLLLLLFLLLSACCFYSYQPLLQHRTLIGRAQSCLLYWILIGCVWSCTIVSHRVHFPPSRFLVTDYPQVVFCAGLLNGLTILFYIYVSISRKANGWHIKITACRHCYWSNFYYKATKKALRIKLWYSARHAYSKGCKNWGSHV